MEVEHAAMCLLYMKHKELDKETDKTLRDLILSFEKRRFQETCSAPPSNYRNISRPIRHASSSLPRPQIKRQKIENENIIENQNENRIENGNGIENGNRIQNGVFKADPEFVEKLNRGEIILTKLPPLGKAIDGIDLPSLPPIKSLQGKIGTCTAPFEKQLTMSDLNVGQARLVFCKDSVKSILKTFMKESEYARVVNDDRKGLEVTVYDHKGRTQEMRLVLWASKTHVLTRGWKDFYLLNEFKIQLDWVTVWMFRHKETENLCFAIMARRFPTNDLIGKAQKNGKKNKMDE